MEDSIDWENWSVQEWLKSIGLNKYEDGFIDNGYDTPDLVAKLGKEDLDAIGVTKKKDRSTLFTQAMKLKEVVSKDVCSTGPPPLLFAGCSTGNSPISPQPPTDSYSEPWSSYSEPWGAAQNGTGSGGSNGITPQMIDVQRKHVPRNVGGGHLPPIKATKGKHMKPPPSPKTPNVAELPVFKRDGGDTGLTTLQLKLKIREELQKDSIILSEYPYSAANQGEYEQLIVDLAEDYSKRFHAESLGVYDALLDVWRQANNTTEFAVPVAIKQATSGKDDVDHNTMSGDPTDNYDEPFDSQLGLKGKQGMTVIKQQSREGSPKKSHTLPSGGSGFQSYEEPFDSVAPSESSPKNVVKKNSSNTLPSPQIQRHAEENRSQVESKKKNKNLSTDKSPRSSPASSPKSSPKPHHRGIRFFKKKEKARSHSVREYDMGKNEKKKKALISFPERSKDDSWSKKKHGSAENLTERNGSALQLDTRLNRTSVGAILYNGNPSPPPLPPPRRVPKSASPTSSESDDSPFPKKKYKGKEFKKFITPPTLKRNEILERGYSSSSSEGDGNLKLHRMQSQPATGSDIEIDRTQGDDEDGKQWLKTSQSFDQLNVIEGISRKKSKKIGLFKRMFKRRSDRAKKHDGNRESLLSTGSAHSGSGDASSSLTASVSMPDIACLTVPGTSRRTLPSPARQIPGSPHTNIKPSDLDLSDEHDPRSHGPVSVSRNSPQSTKKSSPVFERDLSPLMHRRMFVRDALDSSSTNPASTPVQMGGSAPSVGNFIENAAEGSISQRNHTPDLDSLKFSDSEDIEPKSHSRTSTGSGMGPKPPPPPKPQKLQTPKSSPIGAPHQSHNTEETTPISSSAPPPSTPLSNKPPLKPMRARSQKKLTTVSADDSVAGSSGPQKTVLKSGEGVSQPPPPKPAKRVSSTKSLTSDEDQNESKDRLVPRASSKPPPKPARRISSNRSSTADESQDEPSTPEHQPVSSSSATPTASDSNKRPPKPGRTSVTTPPLPDKDEKDVTNNKSITQPVSQPPPKPARRYKSLKIVDPKKNTSIDVMAKSKTLGGSRTVPSLDERSSGESGLTPPGGESNDTGNQKQALKLRPRPAPKPRALVSSKTDSTVTPPAKPPRTSMKRNIS